MGVGWGDGSRVKDGTSRWHRHLMAQADKAPSFPLRLFPAIGFACLADWKVRGWVSLGQCQYLHHISSVTVMVEVKRHYQEEEEVCLPCCGCVWLRLA